MNRDKKVESINALKALAEAAESIVVFDYSGSTVNQLDKLRDIACEHNVTVMVVRNRLAKIAFADTKYSDLSEVLKGASMLAFAHEGPSSSAKVLRAFIKEHNHVVVKGLSIGDSLLAPDNLETIAKMPTRDEALAILARTLVSPAQSIAVALNDGASKLARALKARSEQLN